METRLRSSTQASHRGLEFQLVLTRYVSDPAAMTAAAANCTLSGVEKVEVCGAEGIDPVCGAVDGRHELF